ncbi:MAG: hypothetical protein ACU84J_03920 [Gammaproteobacteria bacterium]
MQTLITRVLPLIVVLFSLTACERTIMREGATPGLRVRDYHQPHASIRLNSVNIIDPNLQSRANKVLGMEIQAFSDKADYIGKIAVENHGGKRTGTGTLEIYVVLRNRTQYPLQVECRALFFDEHEVPVEGPTVWQRVYLDQNGLSSCTMQSTLLNTSYYYVELREGR